MCGIAGIFNLNGSRVDSARLTAMTDRLKHRGPDGTGHYLNGPIGLGQTRLAVIDVEGGKQPIFNEDKTIAVVFNGEIYNFKEIREELEKAGHLFSTNSDTEVIVHLYEKEGVDCVRRFRGMFAFALWDQKRRRLFLARDIVGKKPLYYSIENERLIFGSEIKSLLAVGDGGEVNYAALDLFLKYQFIPGPETIYQKISSLPPAHFMVIDPNGMEINRYWEMPLPSRQNRSEADCVDSLQHVLEEAVQLRLISDVPLGAFLSGGVDSSIIVGLMKKKGAGKIKTFSVGFEEESFDETPFANQAAQFFQTEHQDHRLHYQIEELLPKVLSQFDQPFGDSSAIAVYKLSEMTRRSVTVALSGDGSDELFAGYRRYVGRRLLKYYWLLPRWFREKGIEPSLALLSESTEYYGDSFIRQLHLLTGLSRRIEGNRHELLPTTFSEEELNHLYQGPLKAGLKLSQKSQVQAWADRFSNLDEISQMMWVDFNTYLPDDILVKVDRMSMAHGLEVRSPFLDQKVIETVLKMPIGLKLKNLTTKYILRKAFGNLVPAHLMNRKKHGFMVPLGAGLKKSSEDLFMISCLSRTGGGC
ncbi:MAG: asparagine synthase (glutamine-hydrolyzing) [Candidatus Manganitrophus sp.]|nr:MAG: asparagine synthase (glutamine-hydrolyzing) [Candidatus Manganitrophus sp.]